MFAISGSALAAIVVRSAIIFVALLTLLRVVGRRTLSDVTPMDMVVMLLVSETVSPALTQGDESVTGGLAAAATLIALSAAASHLAYRSRRAEKILSGTTDVLIRDGRVDPAVMRRYRITDADLQMALHQHGALHVGAVARAFVEPDGEITVVKATDVKE